MSRASDGLLESNDYVFLSTCRLSGHGVPCPYLVFLYGDRYNAVRCVPTLGNTLSLCVF